MCMKHDFFDVWNDSQKSPSVSERFDCSGRVTFHYNFQDSIFEEYSIIFT